MTQTINELIAELRENTATQDYVAACGGMTVVDVNKEDLVRILDELARLQMPPDLSPLVTTHPASCAYRVLNPCVGFSLEEQEAMAFAVIARDREVRELRQLLWDISHNDPFTPPKR